MDDLEAQAHEGLGAASRHDIYLSPHSDDVCFSIGELARQRRAGTLLTVFSVSGYSAPGHSVAGEDRQSTTRRRMAEDAAFAAAAGVEPQWMGLPDAGDRGAPPFASRGAAAALALARTIATQLHRTLAGPALGRRREPKPWLFCPAGIGGHVDHLAVLAAVSAMLKPLERDYRVAFYEDLHYASSAKRREAGLATLRAAFGRRRLERLQFPLDDEACTSKMALVRGYASQLTPRISVIGAYTPAAHEGARPHEAVWVLQDVIDQRAG